MPSFAIPWRHAIRRLAAAPLFTITAAATLALGIGANSAIFSIIHGVLLKPLPYHESERLVGLWHRAPGLGIDELNQGPAFHFTYLEENHVFEDVGMWGYNFVSVTGLAEPERIEGIRVTYGVFPILRVQPILGRSFNRADDTDGSPETVMLSYAYWQRKFGGSPAVIGQKIIINGKPKEVIGVLPADFRFLRAKPALFLPFQFKREDIFVGNFSYQGLARLKPGTTMEQANADIARMIPLSLNKFKLPPGFTAKMLNETRLGPNLRPLKQDVVGDVGRVLWVLFGTVGIVLLIACANVANLFLVRAEGRQRELAVRAALGAGQGALARELLAESVSLGILGGALGLLLAEGGIRLLAAIGPQTIPRLEEISLSPPVLIFTAAISILAGLLFGIIPVLKYGRPDLNAGLKEGGRTLSTGRERHRVRNGLVVSQVALALLLLISSGLMLRTFQAMKKVQPGFVRPEEVLTFRVSIPEAEIPDPVQSVQTHQQILQRIQQIPGVASAGLSSSITMDGNDSNDPVFVEEFPAPEGQIPAIRRFKWISPEYFATMGNPLVAGRGISWNDIYSKAPVAVISEALAREYWKDPRKAIGKRIRETPQNPWREIVGVVGNEHDDGVQAKVTAMVYWPMLMEKFWGEKIVTQRSMAYAVRSPRAGNPAFLKEIQQSVWSIAPTFPLASVRMLSSIYEESMARTEFTLLMLGIASAVALLLGVIGIYGVISYTVSQQTREIGIRMALGAPLREVRGIFVRQGLLLSTVGIVLGLGAAGAMTRLMSALLFGISPLDPITFGGVAVALGSVAIIASYLPARRASSVNPVEALHWE